MLEFFTKNKGAISVFLTLILIPTFIFSGVLVDGSRILGAKNLVSGAGELAMNGALANYHEDLKEAYGLLAMADTAGEVESAMQDFFETTLRYVGLEKGDISKALVYLELTDGSFHASNIPGSEIFQTEVLKQEVLEYMKYRAPAFWVQRAIQDKWNLLGDLEKEKDAANGQLQFERQLDGLQEIYDELKKLTSELNDSIFNSINSKNEFNAITLPDAREAYEEIAMLAPAWHSMKNEAANQQINGTTLGLMEKMVENQWSGEISDADNLSKIILMKVISSNVDDPEEILDGIDPVNDWELYEERQELIQNYADAQANMEEGIRATEERLDGLVNMIADDMQEVRQQHAKAVRGVELCDLIDEQLQALESKFADMSDLYGNWENAVKELPSGDSKRGYEDNLNEFDYFEAEGMLDDFRNLINDNRTYFEEVRDQLEELAFVDIPLYQIDSKNDFMGEANRGFIQTRGQVLAEGFLLRDFYHSVDNDRMELSIEKDNIDLKNTNIKGHDFVEYLKKYCDNDTADPARQKAETEKWDGEMDESQKLINDIFSADIDFHVEKNNLPSGWIENGKNSSMDEEEAMMEDFDGLQDKPEIDGGLGDKDTREKSFQSGDDNLNKENAGISSISSLPDLLNQAGESMIEPLIMTEYVMGMFSHYTSNRDLDGNTLEGDNGPESITGDKLEEHANYRAEIEYILWGLPEARDNVTITKSIIFTVNMVFNLSFAFTNGKIKADAKKIAACFPVGAMAQIAITCALQTMVGMVETVKNMGDLLDGKAVPLIKTSSTWSTWLDPVSEAASTTSGSSTTTSGSPSTSTGSPSTSTPGSPSTSTPGSPSTSTSESSSTETGGGDHSGFTYEDYVWILVCVKMFASQKNTLARTADCIELNMTKRDSSNSLKNKYTMVDLEATVSIDTFFLPKLSGAGYNVHAIDDNTFTINYYGVQGY